MNEAAFQPGLPSAADSPFSRRAVLALVGFGVVVFIALLWMIGAGLTSGSTNDGGAHAGGKGLNGYAALAGLMERRGYDVRRSQGEGALDDPGLLVLTPPQWSDAAELERITAARRYTGPTLVILPKWMAAPVQQPAPGAKPGWVQLGAPQSPEWKGFHDEIGLRLEPAVGDAGLWRAQDRDGVLPDAKAVQSASGEGLIPLVTGGDGRILAAFVDDGGALPLLEGMGLSPAMSERQDGLYPLAFVFEPDLLNNYGLARIGNAYLADDLVAAMTAGSRDAVIFDLTLNGHARSANLLTLAFTPPFLAATLCLLIAAVAVGWRALVRFGAPRRADRGIAFGKRALAGNAAGLVRRTRRFHLIGAPYAEASRARLAHELALPRMAGAEQTEAAIDRALAARQGDDAPVPASFSAIAARLRAARRPQDVLRAAQDLHALERTLMR